MMKLKSLCLGGFKSFAPGKAEGDGSKLELGDVTVLLGPNGAGKSNLVSFFKMLGYLATGALQRYVGDAGTAETLLHYGPGQTTLIDTELVFEGDDATGLYTIALAPAAPDTLLFSAEALTWQRAAEAPPYRRSFGSGHRESLLEQAAQQGQKPCGVMLRLLQGCRVYQFHDTSENATLRQRCPHFSQWLARLEATGGR